MHEAVLELKKRLQHHYGNRLVRFIVFGSYARGEQTPDSDIDILITLKGKVDWNLEREILHLTYKIELKRDVLMDIKVYSEEDIQHTLLGATPFMENVMEEGIPV